jgi:hypothetical protein
LKRASSAATSRSQSAVEHALPASRKRSPGEAPDPLTVRISMPSRRSVAEIPAMDSPGQASPLPAGNGGGDSLATGVVAPVANRSGDSSWAPQPASTSALVNASPRSRSVAAVNLFRIQQYEIAISQAQCGEP